jgi:hypothetical protein
MVPIASLGKHLSEEDDGSPKGKYLKHVPAIMGSCVGWATASAFRQLLHELLAAHPGVCFAAGDGADAAVANATEGAISDPAGFASWAWLPSLEGSGCVPAEIGFSLVCSFVAVVIISVLRPFTESNSIECMDHPCIDWFERWTEDLLSLLVTAASKLCMDQWYFSLKHLVGLGMVGGVSDGTRTEMLILWAFTIFFFGTVLSTKLERWEDRLRRRLKKSKPGTWLHSLTNASIDFSNTAQEVLGYVAGCSALDVVLATFSSLNLQPSWGILLSNLAVALGWTATALAYLTFNGRGEGSILNLGAAFLRRPDRDTVERFFVTTAMSYFVGTTWLTVASDLITHTARALELSLGTPPGERGGVMAALALFLPCFTILVELFQVNFVSRLGDTIGATEGDELRSRRGREGQRAVDYRRQLRAVVKLRRLNRARGRHGGRVAAESSKASDMI